MSDMSDMRSRFGLFDLMVCVAAALTGLLVSAVLQSAGLAQPYALAIALPCSFLVLYPAVRRWSRGKLRFYKWAIVGLLVGLFGLLLDLVAVRL